MKFSSQAMKEAAVEAAAKEFGETIAAMKLAEWKFGEATRGYCPETDAPVVADLGHVPSKVTSAPVAKEQPAEVAKEEAPPVVEKAKRGRKPKATATEPTPVAAEGAPASEVQQPKAQEATVSITGAPEAPAEVANDVYSIVDIRDRMTRFYTLLGGKDEHRAPVVEVLQNAAGVTMAAAVPEDKIAAAVEALDAAIQKVEHQGAAQI